jgi:hypothetical protein
MGGAGAAQQVQGPAIGLLVVGGLAVLGQLISLAANIFGTGMAGLQNMGGGNPAADRYFQYMSGGLGIVFGIIGLGLYAFLIWAALQMKQLRKWNISVAGSIVAMLPCSCCCIIGLPIGIWSLIVLMKPEVKSAFVG